jgi:molybdenum cofactor cytidylyltransferase
MLHDIKCHGDQTPKTDNAVNDQPSRCYAIVPAAGRSRRMGQPKLLLPWGDGLMIDRVLQAWTRSRVSQVVVVIRQADTALAAVCQRWPVRLVQPPNDPEDMKESVQIGLRVIAEEFQPTGQDRCFIAPADLPTLSASIIDRMIAAESDPATIVVPQFGDKQGHPVLLPWPITEEIFQLGEHEGVNRIVERHEKRMIPFSQRDAVSDIDTPADYRRGLDRS